MDPFQVNMLAHMARLEQLQEEMVKLLRSLCIVQGNDPALTASPVWTGYYDKLAEGNSEAKASQQMMASAEDKESSMETLEVFTDESDISLNNTPLISSSVLANLPDENEDVGDTNFDEDLYGDINGDFMDMSTSLGRDWIIDWDIPGLNERKRRVANIFRGMGNSEGSDIVGRLLLNNFVCSTNTFNSDSLIIHNFTHTGAISPIYAQDLATSSGLSLLARQRRYKGHGRIISISKMNPTSITIALMSAAVEYEMATMRADAQALYKHVSKDKTHAFWRASDFEPGSSVPTWSFSVTYFGLYDGCPDLEPMMPLRAGVFTSTSPHRTDQDKYIREEKLTVVFMYQDAVETDDINLFPDLTSLPQGSSWMLLTFGGLTNFSEIGTSPDSLLNWTKECFEQIALKWDAVLGELDRQIGVRSDVVFNSEVRRKLLFEDEDFSNSNRYFWALQSLRVFSEYVDQTINMLPGVFGIRDDQIHTLPVAYKFLTLRKRIERKRQEVQALSDSLFAASSVMEARIAAEQNTTVRLLTLSTIAFLPVSLTTSFFSSDVIPDGAATFSTFIITSVILTITTFLVVFNMDASRWLFARLYRRYTRKLEECMKNHPEETWRIRGQRLQTYFESRNAPEPSTTWWYVGFILHIFSPRPIRTGRRLYKLFISYLRGSPKANEEIDLGTTPA